MKHLELDVYEPGDMLATMTKDGKVAVLTVGPDGNLVPSDNRLFASGLSFEDPIEALDLTVRTFNVLMREGIHTIGQAIAIYDEKGSDGFVEMRNMGEKGVTEIVSHIQRLRGQD
jgi:DNA-directed RNA polymerase alpha subunit